MQLKKITNVQSALAHLLTITKGPANRFVSNLSAGDYRSIDELLQAFEKNFDAQKSDLNLKRDIQARKYTSYDNVLKEKCSESDCTRHLTVSAWLAISRFHLVDWGCQSVGNGV